ncbi:MAG: bifunctional ornithine acetyltransferase/N-acetylglutamate synthase, partial [Elusimicrobia bacterium]|nr:bifunctional ornithine acetyltransferase/N-acetylglutamate synthase [Elusimicrobiota bacterium]
ARKMTEITGEALGVDPREVLVMSTGIIGRPFPYEKIREALPGLVKGLSPAKGGHFAKAIMTTDLKMKQAAVRLTLGGKTVTIGGCAKGSGMIEPNMATMLSCITTDAAVSPKLLKEALKEAVEESFNSITVDGCMSTNDMVCLLANGEAGNRPLSRKDGEYDLFLEGVKAVCLKLAKDIVLDGEGAERFFEILISGARSVPEARRVAKQVANSNLVKTADYTDNPNWGRVAAAIGATGIPVKEENLKIQFSVQGRKVLIKADLGLGKAVATVYTCDLTHAYIDINGRYN